MKQLIHETVSEEMLRLLAALREKVVIGFVGGSDLAKQKEQLGENCDTNWIHGLGLELFDYCFSENGLTAFCMGEPLPSQVKWIHLMIELYQLDRRRKVQKIGRFYPWLYC